MSKPIEIRGGDNFVYIPPNEAMLEIARLYLERYELLEPADRALFRQIIDQFNTGRTLAHFDHAEVVA